MELNICESRLFKLKLFYIHFHPTTRKSPLKLNDSVRKQKKGETKLGDFERKKSLQLWLIKDFLNIVSGEILQIQR